jgi:hypothetical protein
MIRKNIPEQLEPEERELRQHAPFVWNRGRQHNVKRREPVCGDQEQLTAHFVQIAHLPSVQKVHTGKFRFPDDAI